MGGLLSHCSSGGGGRSFHSLRHRRFLRAADAASVDADLAALLGVVAEDDVACLRKAQSYEVDAHEPRVFVTVRRSDATDVLLRGRPGAREILTLECLFVVHVLPLSLTTDEWSAFCERYAYAAEQETTREQNAAEMALLEARIKHYGGGEC